MQKILMITILLFLIFASVSSASPFMGGDLKLSFNLDYQTLSLNDSADQVYIGNINSGSIGFGGHADIIYPYNNLFSWGGNFDFTYCQAKTSFYDITVINPSIGPVVKFNLGGGDLYVSANYNLGYVSTDQTTSAAAAAGSFVANKYGWIFSVRGLFPAVNNIALGPYVSYGSQVLYAFKYKSGGTNRWVDIGINTLQYGLAINI